MSLMTGIGKDRRARTFQMAIALGLSLSSPASAGQDRRELPEEPPSIVMPQTGQTAESSAGRAGQRQTRATAAEAIGTVPLARIDNRIPNRVQSRIRNRIDRNYDPRANAASPFVVAGERVREATGPRRR